MNDAEGRLSAGPEEGEEEQEEEQEEEPTDLANSTVERTMLTTQQKPAPSGSRKGDLERFHQAIDRGDLANATTILQGGGVALNRTAAVRNAKGVEYPLATFAIMKRYFMRPKVVSPEVMYGVDRELHAFLQAMVSKGGILNTRGKSPLWEAARLKSVPLVRFLLQQGCDPNTKGPNGWAPMHVAMGTAGEIEVLAMRLMEAGRYPKLDASTKRWVVALGQNASFPAAKESAAVLLHVLKTRKQWVDRVHLKAVMQSWALHIVRLLAEAGGRVDLQDDYGRTPLHLAAQEGGTELAAYLVERAGSQKGLPRGDWLAKDAFGFTARQYADSAAGWGSQSRIAHQYTTATTQLAAGGWRQLQHLPAAYKSCDVAIEENITPEAFFRNYYLMAQPVLLKGTTKQWALHAAMNRTGLQRRFGNRTVPEATQCYESPMQGKLRQWPLGAFVKQMRARPGEKLMVDGAKALEHLPELPQSLFPPMPPVLSPQWGDRKNLTLRVRSVGFQLGSLDSGCGPHFRGDAWHVTSFGRKRWFLQHPKDALYSSSTVKDWIGGKYSHLLRGVECTQHPGDLLYIPGAYSRAVLHLEETVGVAGRFSTALRPNDLYT